MERKKVIHTVVDRDIYAEFLLLATRKFRMQRGALSAALEEAMKLWIEKEGKENSS